jgi:phosphonoacetaldehyde hydrolase
VRLLAVLPQFAEPIPGAIETLAFLRSRGVRIGSTTGYTRPMMNVLEPLSRAAGVVVDALICADEVPQGRPAPWACLRLAEQFSLSSTSRALKVGDTPADMGEGVNAGMLAIGLTVSGNEVGQSLSAWNALPPTEQAATVRIADERLRAAGAAHTLPSVAELPALLEQLNLI